MRLGGKCRAIVSLADLWWDRFQEVGGGPWFCAVVVEAGVEAFVKSRGCQLVAL